MVNEEPSKELLLTVDLVLEKYPYQPIHTLAWIPHIMTGEREKLDNITFTTLIELIRTDSRTIRNFLLKEGYLKCIDWRNPTDELTDKGKLAKEKGGHAKYKEWEAEQERKKRIEDFPKKKWIIYEPLKYVVLLFIGMGINQWICHTKENNDQKPSQAKEQPSTSPTPPKLSDTTNTVK